MDKSKFLSKVLGIYFLIISVGMFMSMPQFTANVKVLISNPSILFVSGFFTLILGLLMVVSHNIWQWSWRVVITIIAWIIVWKGVTYIFFPHMIDQSSTLFVQNMKFAYTAAFMDLILGLFLTYMGFKKDSKS